MNKSKALSIITSVAMTGSMILSAIPFTASAAAANPLSLAITADQKNFTPEELAAGKTVTVYVDTVGTVTEADKVGSVEFKLKSSAWGKVDPIDLVLSAENGLGTAKGNTPKAAFNQTGTMVISLWDDAEKPSKPGYAIQKYNDVEKFNGYSDAYLPAALIMSDSAHGFLTTSATTKHIAEFKVKLPADLAEGKYTISLVEARSMICVDGEFGSNNSELVDTAVSDLVFTVGAGSSDDILWGDANLDGKVNVRDCATIASALAKGQGDKLPVNADYNRDDKKNVRDAADRKSVV